MHGAGIWPVLGMGVGRWALGRCGCRPRGIRGLGWCHPQALGVTVVVMGAGTIGGAIGVSRWWDGRGGCLALGHRARGMGLEGAVDVVGVALAGEGGGDHWGITPVGSEGCAVAVTVAVVASRLWNGRG
jgi:hypothetical protein